MISKHRVILAHARRKSMKEAFWDDTLIKGMVPSENKEEIEDISINFIMDNQGSYDREARQWGMRLMMDPLKESLSEALINDATTNEYLMKGSLEIMKEAVNKFFIEKKEELVSRLEGKSWWDGSDKIIKAICEGFVSDIIVDRLEHMVTPVSRKTITFNEKPNGIYMVLTHNTHPEELRKIYQKIYGEHFKEAFLSQPLSTQRDYGLNQIS